jgi:hypothetical protein
MMMMMMMEYESDVIEGAHLGVMDIDRDET